MSENTPDIAPKRYATAQFQPVTVTVETLQVLSKQDKYAELLALYMAYVEITTWQHTNSIKATTEFMSRRLHWSDARIRDRKKALIGLGLVEDSQGKGEGGKFGTAYIIVKHVVSPHSGFDGGAVSSTPSAYNLQLSAYNLKENKSETSEKPPTQDVLTVYRTYLTRFKLDHGLYAALNPDQRTELLEKTAKSYRLTDKRKSKIVTRLKEFGVGDLVRAIENISESSWHNGTGSNGWVAELEWIMGSTEKVEKWANKDSE